MTMMAEKHAYALFGDRTLHIAYFRDVKNSAALRQATLDKQIDAALINAQLVVDRFQVHAAAARALLCDQSKRLTTKSLHAELVFNLSGSRNVSESFRRFGVSDDCTSLAVCVFDADDATLEKTLALVDGTATSVDELGQHLTPADVKLIKKYYKIQDQELTNSSLADAITCRIATKSCNK